MKFVLYLYWIGNDIVVVYFVDFLEGIMLIDVGLFGYWYDL